MKISTTHSFALSAVTLGIILAACSSGGTDAADEEGGSLGQGGSSTGGSSEAGGKGGGAGNSGGAGQGGTSAAGGGGAPAGEGGAAGVGGAAGAKGGTGGAVAGSGGTSGSAGSGGSGGSDAGAGGSDAGSGGASGSAGSGGEAGAGGDAAGGNGGASGNAGSATAGAGGASAGSSGSAGAGGMFVWPDCKTQPMGSPTKALHDIWQDNPAAPTAAWVPGVYVTAISYGACSTGVACEIFLQQKETFPDLTSGSQQSLKMFISANTAHYFLGVKLGDQVDAYGWAWRYNVGGQNELLLQVNEQFPGCANPVGTGTPTPVTVALTDLTIAAYETTVGPLLIEVPTVSGRPVDATSIFALWDTAMGPSGDITDATSLTSFYLTGGQFTGLMDTKITDFTSATGVFSLYLQPTTMTKYKTIGPRTIGEVPILKVH